MTGRSKASAKPSMRSAMQLRRCPYGVSAQNTTRQRTSQQRSLADSCTALRARASTRSEAWIQVPRSLMAEHGTIDENAILGEIDLDFLANKARHEIANDPKNIGTARMWWSSVLAVVNEVKRTRKLINTPHTSNFIEAVKLEAAHQINRWGVQHDAGKRP